MSFNYKRFVLSATILMMAFVACNSNSGGSETAANVTLEKTVDNASAATENYYGSADTTAQAAPPAANEEQPKKAGSPAVAAANVDWDKKIIKNASLTIEAKDHRTFNDYVHEQVKRAGAYVAQEEQNRSEYKIENIVTIKVPVDQFDNLVRSLSSTKDENLVSQKITSQDVTGEVIDTRSRTEAKRQIRLRYLDLLKQAKNMEEILKVQQEINNIQVEIEAGAGRVSYLTHAAAYSTIQLTFYEILDPSAQYNDRPGFGKRVLNALSNGMDWIGEMLIVVLTLWPLWLLIGIGWWFVRRWRARTAFNSKK
ncbi:DUF4349 domain-containing protein [Longitalea arenae]|uniref:DUF4349 domain-containing protein n=1 Tax=Longitalea arenae TaxID=2812558 RepID=UPI0019684192|nr:DUF4349 domain-containing protein [Longitalea arenae]